MNLETLRVDHTGSLMRPPALQDAFERHKAGALDAAGLRRVQDACIPPVIVEQERHGLPVVTDGELRRTGYMDSFAEVRGWEWGERPFQARSGGPRPATARLELVTSKPLDEYTFATRTATRPVKMALVNIDHLRGGFDAAGSRAVYADVDEFERDLLAISRRMVAGLVEAGCRYVQIDGPSYAFRFIDGRSVEALRARGHDPQALLQHAIDLDNAMIEGFDEGVTFGLHVCRGNNAAGTPRSGSYEGIAERLFNGLRHRRLLLEYDDEEREGDFSPLRFVPEDKVVVLGLVTTKSKRIETVDELRRRIDRAAAYVPPERLAISPQCGFRHGGFNPADYPHLPGADEQWRKLDVLLETAAAVWGSVDSPS
jgi:5-methyltetrahydropteroyltriglutamate--homocysteine methyltransferase